MGPESLQSLTATLQKNPTDLDALATVAKLTKAEEQKLQDLNARSEELALKILAAQAAQAAQAAEADAQSEAAQPTHVEQVHHVAEEGVSGEDERSGCSLLKVAKAVGIGLLLVTGGAVAYSQSGGTGVQPYNPPPLGNSQALLPYSQSSLETFTAKPLTASEEGDAREGYCELFKPRREQKPSWMDKIPSWTAKVEEQEALVRDSQGLPYSQPLITGRQYDSQPLLQLFTPEQLAALEKGDAAEDYFRHPYEYLPAQCPSLMGEEVAEEQEEQEDIFGVWLNIFDTEKVDDAEEAKAQAKTSIWKQDDSEHPVQFDFLTLDGAESDGAGVYVAAATGVAGAAAGAYAWLSSATTLVVPMFLWKIWKRGGDGRLVSSFELRQ